MSALARGFSWQHRITEFASIGYASPLRICVGRIYLSNSLRACPSITTDWYGYLPASPHRLTTTTEVPTQPHQRLGGLASPRNPWIFGGGDSHSSFATHANILTRPRSTTGSPAASPRDRRSATARLERRTRGFGITLEPRYIVRAGSLDQ